MKNTVRLALANLKYYKKQTAALFVGILLSAALLTGVGSLFGSGKAAARENARREYGDWHYEMRCDFPWMEEFEKNPRGKGFQVEQYGVETVRKAISQPFNIQYVYGDPGYLEMMGRRILEGHYPQTEQEIAADEQTLGNLGVSGGLGSQVTLDGETFTLCGILTEMPQRIGELLGDHMQVFVCESLDYGMNGSFLYLKFEESRPVYDQMEAFAKTFGVDGSSTARNSGLAGYVGGEKESVTLRQIAAAFTDPSLGIPWVWGMLNENEALTEGAVLLALALFSVFIIYSIFQVSLLKRLSQYSVMQTLGMTDVQAFGMLAVELLMIFAAGYGAGAALGNGAAALIYRRVGRIFITRNVTLHSGVDTSANTAQLSVSDLPDAGTFYVNWKVLWMGAAFLVLVLAAVSFLLMRRMRKLTIRQMLVSDTGKRKRNRKIFSLKRENLTGILTKRFMFSRKGTFAGVLLSLSVGGVIFLGAVYVAENTRINNELTFKADDGLGSDIQVYEEQGSLKDTIPQETADRLEEISGLEAVMPVRYLLGEIPLEDGAFRWPEYFPETAEEEGFDPDPELMEKYNGQIVRTGEDDYRIKVNIYGYDDAMLESLGDYLLEGEIDPQRMRQENTVILKTLMDGQGNYDGIDIAAGDTLRLKTPGDPQADGEILKFLGEEEAYQEQELTVDAVVSRPLAKVETFIGGSSSVDIIMTNEQMEENFGISGYQTISISVKDGADAKAAADEIRREVSGISGCVVRDYSAQIEAQNLYLDQQMMFFVGIAVVLLAISLLHIMNSMQYLVAERRYEFSVLRAMGITDAGFLKMLVKEGLRYGIYASLVMLVLYGGVQRVLHYFLVHVYLYLHPQGAVSPIYVMGMAALNLVLCTGAMAASGRSILGKSILEQM